MPTEWYYTQHGQQQGPVSAAQIKEMAAAGTLRGEDLVWNSSMTEWVPASRVKGLFVAGTHGAADDAAPAHPFPVESTATPTYGVNPEYATPRQAIPYASHTGSDVPVTPRTIDLLRQTRPWVLFNAILMFTLAGLMSFVALLLAGMGAPFIYIGVGPIMAIPPLYLMRYFSRIGVLIRGGCAIDLENALEAQKSYWKFMGIFAIIVIAIYVVVAIVRVTLGRF